MVSEVREVRVEEDQFIAVVRRSGWVCGWVCWGLEEKIGEEE